MSARFARLAALYLCATVACAPLAWADTIVRVGDHPGFGRVVFDLAAKQGHETTRAGDRLLVVLKGAGPVQAPARMPRNVAGIEGGVDSAIIVLAPGAEPRVARLGDRLVVDALDRAATVRPAPPGRPAQRDVSEAAPSAAASAPALPPAMVPDPAAARPAPAPAKQPAARSATVEAHKPVAPAQPPGRPATLELPKPATPEPSPPQPAAREAPTPAPAEEQRPAVTQAPLPPPESPPPEPPPPAIVVLPAEPATGAAAFRRGGLGIVVLDRRAAGGNAPAGMTDSGSASLFQAPLPPGMALRLTRVPTGWSVERVPTPDAPGRQPQTAPNGTLFPVPRPGRVVTVLDPLSGATLIVGTSLDASATPMQGAERRTPAFALLPSWLGIVVEAGSDATDLRAVQAGFLLTGGPLPATEPAAAMTRRFDLPGGEAPALMNRMKAQLAGAATALPRARARERLAAAATMVALGLGAEAQAVGQLAITEDPQVAADATAQALVATAALIAGRPEEADALDDPRLDGTDEIALWRGLRDRRLGKDTVAAQGLGSKAPLALSYPATLSRLVLPDVAESAVESGASFPEEKLSPYAKAILLERRGKRDEAIAAFDALSNGADRLDQVRGAVKATELRLVAGQMAPRDAVGVMERLSFAWRGDGREAAFRMRAAELRGQAGEWRGALDALREIEKAFPDQKPAVRARMAGVMQAMLAADGGTMSPLDVVLLAMEHADAVMGGEAGAALSRLLATKLSALDLPARAIPVLQGLMRGVPQGEARATLGARLAQVLLDGEEPDAALAALDNSAADGLPDALLESRALLRARVQAALGDTAGAAAGLAVQGSPAADELRASLLARAGDWRGAMAALASLAERAVPASGPLDEAAQEILLRQATAATQAGDPAALRSLAASAERLTPPRDTLFRVLTAAPVTGLSDLPRAARELRLARALPQPLPQQTRAAAR